MAGVFFDRFGRDISFRAVDDEHSEFSVDINVSSQFYGWWITFITIEYKW